MDEVKIRDIRVKTVLTKSNLPIAGYSVNPYVGCTHACKYCYACFMKRFTGHDEPWGTFLDVKHWEPIKNPQRYDRQTMIVGSVTDLIIRRRKCSAARALSSKKCRAVKSILSLLRNQTSYCATSI